jgi:predicted permease
MFQDLRLAARQLRKTPGFTVVVVLTLGLGIGASTAIFSLVNAVLLRPLPYPDHERIVTLWSGDGSRRSKAPGPDFRDWREQSRSFSGMAATHQRTNAVVVAQTADNAGAIRVSDDFFAVMGQRPQSGRLFTPEEVLAGNAAAVSTNFLRRHFGGDPARAIGATIQVWGQNLHIVGVMAPGFDFPDHTEIWAPLNPARLIPSRSAHNYEVVARLQPGVTLEQAQAEMTGIAARLAQSHTDSSKQGVRVIPLHRILVDRYELTIWLLFGAVLLLMLIACANIANLLLARGLRRQQELAVRAALGASRGRIAWQLLAECLLLALASGAAGLVLATWGLRALLALAPEGVPRLEHVAIDQRTLLFATGMSVVVCLLTGLFPVFQATRKDLAVTLRAGGRGISGPRGRLRAGLVIAQLAISLILLADAGLLLRTTRRLAGVDPGYRPHRLLVMAGVYTGIGERRGERALAFFEELTRRAGAAPGVLAVSYASALPIDSIGSWGTYTIEGRPALLPTERGKQNAIWRVVGPEFFSTLGIPVTSGRPVERRDTGRAPRVVVINKSMARASWPGGNAIGQRITFGWVRSTMEPMTIVGVVADTRQGTLGAPVREELYIPAAQHPDLALGLKVITRTASEPLTLSETLRAQARALDPTVPVKFTTADGLIQETLSAPRFRGLIIGLFAGLALLLSVVGIAGVMACLVSERRNEIGVRMAVGAGPSDVLRHFLGRGMRLAVVGAGVGLGGSLATSHVLQSLLYEVDPSDPGVLVGVSSLLLLSALAAASWPAVNAARVSPMTVLREQ